MKLVDTPDSKSGSFAGVAVRVRPLVPLLFLLRAKLFMNEQHSQTIKVEYAGVSRRIAAFVYDIFLIAALWFALFGVAVAIHQGEAIPIWASQFILLPAAFIMTFIFYYWFWTHGGQTLGMRAWRLRIINLENKQPAFRECLIRYLLAVSSLGLGFLYCVFNKDKKSLHDVVSHTQIVLLPKELK